MILALDQASLCGWAAGDDTVVACGLIDSTPRRFESQGMRFVKFEKELVKLIDRFNPSLVVIEEHRAHTGVQAAQILGAYAASVMRICDERNINYTASPVVAHKRAFTGTTRASKELTLAVANKKFPHLNIPSFDIADACSIWWWAKHKV